MNPIFIPKVVSNALLRELESVLSFAFKKDIDKSAYNKSIQNNNNISVNDSKVSKSDMTSTIRIGSTPEATDTSTTTTTLEALALQPNWHKLEVDYDKTNMFVDYQYFYNTQSHHLIKLLRQRVSNVDNQINYHVYVSHPKGNFKPSLRAKIMKELFDNFINDSDTARGESTHKSTNGFEATNGRDMKNLHTPATSLTSTERSRLIAPLMLGPHKSVKDTVVLQKLNKAKSSLTSDYLDQEWFGVSTTMIYLSASQALSLSGSDTIAPAPHLVLTNFSWPNVDLLLGMFKPLGPEHITRPTAIEESIFERNRTPIVIMCILEEVLEIMREDLPVKYFQIQDNKIIIDKDMREVYDEFSIGIEDKLLDKPSPNSPILEAFMLPYANANNFFFIRDNAASWRGFALGPDQALLNLRQLIEVDFAPAYMNFQIDIAQITKFDAEIVKCETALRLELENNYEEHDVIKHLNARRELLAIDITKLLLEEQVSCIDEASLAPEQKKHALHKI